MTPSRPVDGLSIAQARRIALTAQGFRDRRHARPTMRTFDRTLARTGLLQVDSVNVVQRAHYLPLFSRMGPYDPGLLHRAAQRRPRRVVEYWAHAQAFMPVELWPVMVHRMEGFGSERGKWTRLSPPGFDATVLERVRDLGAVTARQLDDGRPRRREHWGWNWSAARTSLDHLALVGELAIAGRTPSFEPLYDLPERVLPPHVLSLPTPSKEAAHRELIRRAARSHGVGTEGCLRDYYRMGPSEARPAIRTLVEDGELLPVRVEGWDRTAYLHRDAALPRQVHSRALLAPFDPLVWERTRTEQIFGFRYRIEIYVPAARRVHGYYVLPFLYGDRLVGRVDLRADRRAGVLEVKGSYAEADAPPETASELAQELQTLATWLSLDRVRVLDHGDLSGPLAGEVARR